jgi:DNA-binding response OmpR family regulator
MATVLVIASDRMIGGLVGQLADLTGHAAQFRADGEDLGDAIKQASPDVVMLDAAYGSRAMDVAATVAAEVGAVVVYFGAAFPVGELRRLALQRGAKYFALPAGPKLLGRILSAALADGGSGRQIDDSSMAYYAVTSACAAAFRARALVDRSLSIRTESRVIRDEHEAVLADCRRRYADLREAVIAYTRELRSAGVPPDRTLELVKTALRAKPTDKGPVTDTGSDIDDAVEWCLHAYYAA